MLADAADALEAGASAAWTPDARAHPATKAKAVNRGNARVGNMVEISGVRLHFRQMTRPT
jgi:hypothetical protein